MRVNVLGLLGVKPLLEVTYIFFFVFCNIYTIDKYNYKFNLRLKLTEMYSKIYNKCNQIFRCHIYNYNLKLM